MPSLVPLIFLLLPLVHSSCFHLSRFHRLFYFLALFSKDFLKYVLNGKISENGSWAWRHPRWHQDNTALAPSSLAPAPSPHVNGRRHYTICLYQKVAVDTLAFPEFGHQIYCAEFLFPVTLKCRHIY
jgi:hypothetical protein